MLTGAVLGLGMIGRHHARLLQSMAGVRFAGAVATGRVESGLVFSSTVDWLSPTKVRRTRILGERGMLLADTLTADLTFFANGHVTSEWGAAQALRGVSEDDATVRVPA